MSITLARRNTAALGRLFGAQGLLWPLATPALVAVALLQRLCGAEIDLDYWWHLATGRWMLDHGRVPAVDPFSFTHFGQSWYAHEWLGELIFALADKIGGYALNIALTALVLGGGFYLLWRAARLYGASRRSAAVAVAAAVLFTLQTVAVRPQVWAFALIMALMHELVAYEVDARRRLWHLPLLFVLLININLLALLGGLLLAIYALHRAVLCWQARYPSPVLSPKRGEERSAADAVKNVLTVKGGKERSPADALKHVLIVGGLSVAALCLNPRGPALLLFAARAYVDAGSPYYSAIQEWRPLGPTPFNVGLYAVGALALALIGWAMWRRRALWPGLPALLFAVMAARSARYVPLFGITAALACAWCVAAARQERDLALPQAPQLGRMATLALLLATALALLVGRQQQFRITPDATRNGYFPVAATGWLRRNAPDARLFAEYGWGGYLDEALYPRSNVFIDGRAEMFGVDLFKSYLDIAGAKPGWQQTLTADGVNAVLLQPDSRLAAALAADPGWRLAFRDAHSVLYTPAANSRSLH